MFKVYLRRFYLEYDPKAFKQARTNKVLDNIPIESKHIPELVEALANEYNVDLDILNRNVRKNKIDNPNKGRIIIWNNNFYYTASDFMHSAIIMYLIINEGLDFHNDPDMIENYAAYISDFVGLDLSGNNIQLAEYYAMGHSRDLIKEINQKIQNNDNNYKTIINKIEKLSGKKFNYKAKINY